MARHAPGHLKATGRAFWKRLHREYAIEDSAGLALLQTAAECADRIAEARAIIDAEGAVVRDRYGSPKAHPAHTVEKDARNQMLAAIKQLNVDLEPLADAPGRPPESTGWTGNLEVA